MAADTWTTRDLPVLAALVQHFDDPYAQPVRWPDIARLARVDEDTAKRALGALCRAAPALIEGIGAAQEPIPIVVTGVTERAMSRAGQWPTPEAVVDKLIATLTGAAEAEPNEEKRSKLMAAALVLSSVGREVAIGWATGMIPHP